MENAQYGTTSLSSRLFRSDNCCFPNENSQIDTENDKNPKFFQFLKILYIFPKFTTDSIDWNVEKALKGTKRRLWSKKFLKSLLQFSK